MARCKKTTRKKGKAGWRVGKSGSVYKTKGKTASRRKTYKTKAAAKRAAKKR